MLASRALLSRGFALLGLLIVLVIILIMFSMYGLAPSGNPGGGQNAGSGLFGTAPQNAPTIARSTSDAIYAARQAVKAVIAEPQLAEFPLPDDPAWGVTDLGAGALEVVGRYDVRDRAGLPVPHSFTVRLAPDSDKKLRASYVEVDGTVLRGP